MNLNKLYILLLILFIPNALSFGNKQTKIDSLENKLKTAKGIEKIKTYNSLSTEYKLKVPEKAFDYANKAFQLSKELNNEKQQAESLYNLGEALYYKNNLKKSLDYYFKSLKIFMKFGTNERTANLLNDIGIVYNDLDNYNKALEYYQKSLHLKEKINDKEGIAQSLNNIGLAYDNMSEYDKALEYYIKSLKIEQELNNKEGIAQSNMNIGNIYEAWGNYEKALKYCLKALKTDEELNIKEDIAMVTNNIGIIYDDWGNNEKALEYYEKSLTIEKELGNKNGIAQSYNNIAIIYDDIGNYEKASEYYEKSLKLQRQLGNKRQISLLLSNIGELNNTKRDYNKALEYYKKSLLIDKEIFNYRSIAQTYNQIGNVYVNLKNIKKAIKYYNKSLKMAKSIKSIETILENYKGFSNAYFSSGNYKKAFNYSNLYHTLKDSIFNDKSQKQITQIQTGYEIEKKEKEIELLNKEKQLKNIEIHQKKEEIKKQKILIIFFISGFVIILIFSFLLIKQIKQKNKTNKLLLNQNTIIQKSRKELIKAKEKAEESDRLKTAFLSNMSHEIRTPMNAIIGFSNLLSDTDITNDERKEFIELIDSNSNSLMNLIEDIIDISKIEAGQLIIKKTKTPVNKIFSELYNSFNQIKNEKDKTNIELRLNLANKEKDFTIITDPHRFKQILSNLLDNAVKFTEKGFIEFGYSINNQSYLQFYVKDTGIGIPNDKMNIIFDRFRQVDGSNTRKYGGTGLGLAISKNLVELLGGKMWLESQIDKGTTFYFTLPYNPAEKAVEKTQIITKHKKKYIWNNKIILIAEDTVSNYQFLEAALRKTKANLLWAQDGKEAVDMCKANDKINLILMDIQMPVLNGYKAARQIRQFRKDLPIIAETAFAMSGDREKSLEAGCDDYIAKPIKIAELLEKIDKWLK